MIPGPGCLATCGNLLRASPASGARVFGILWPPVAAGGNLWRPVGQVVWQPVASCGGMWLPVAAESCPLHYFTPRMGYCKLQYSMLGLTS